MPRRCTVCGHRDREAIELAVVRNGPYRAIAARFGVDRKAIERHHRNHMREPEPEPTPADRQREADAEHRERLRIEKHHVLAGLLRVVQMADVGAATVSAWREIAKLEGFYPPKDVRVEHIQHFDDLSSAEIDALLAIEDDAELLAALAERGIAMNGSNGIRVEPMPGTCAGGRNGR